MLSCEAKDIFSYVVEYQPGLIAHLRSEQEGRLEGYAVTMRKPDEPAAALYRLEGAFMAWPLTLS